MAARKVSVKKQIEDRKHACRYLAKLIKEVEKRPDCPKMVLDDLRGLYEMGIEYWPDKIQEVLDRL